MALLKLYENYVEKLVKCLPLDDAHFITKLSANQLLPGDTENKIKSLQTQSDKALYFLNHVIKPALDIGILSGFKKLLSIMHNCGYDHVQELSCQIEQDMNEPIQPGIVMCICMYIIHIFSLLLLTLATCITKHDLICSYLINRVHMVPLKDKVTLTHLLLLFIKRVSFELTEKPVACVKLSIFILYA